MKKSKLVSVSCFAVIDPKGAIYGISVNENKLKMRLHAAAFPREIVLDEAQHEMLNKKARKAGWRVAPVKITEVKP